jgi:hypothetical protein
MNQSFFALTWEFYYLEGYASYRIIEALYKAGAKHASRILARTLATELTR